MRESAAYVTVSAGTLAFIAVVVLLILCPHAFGSLSNARKYIVSVQGRNRCPDFKVTGTRRVTVSRSHLECSKNCALWSGCLHYSYQRDNGSCTLFSTTPANLYPANDCVFMLDPKIYQGCISTAALTTNPNRCSLPFQYGNVEFYGCRNTTSVPQCIAYNGQWVDCIAPPGHTAKQDTVTMTLGSAVVLPCMNSWIILMQRFNESFSFSGNWAIYKQGFGDIRGTDFWIGNENMNRITKVIGMTYRLRIEVQTVTTSKWYYAEYATFSIDSEAKKYAIHLTGYSGNAGDSMTNTTLVTRWYHNGMKFSTPEADNDLGPQNCAGDYDAPFWYNACWYACLTCKFSTPDFSWFTLHDAGLQDQGQLRAARMMIRSN